MSEPQEKKPLTTIAFATFLRNQEKEMDDNYNELLQNIRTAYPNKSIEEIINEATGKDQQALRFLLMMAIHYSDMRKIWTIQRVMFESMSSYLAKDLPSEIQTALGPLKESQAKASQLAEELESKSYILRIKEDDLTTIDWIRNYLRKQSEVDGEAHGETE